MAGSSGVETEFKRRVDSERDLEAVAAAAGDGPRATARQENHFFDTADRVLAAAGWALRLRDEDGRFFLTAKGPKGAARTDVGAVELAARPEVEAEVPAELARAILDGRAAPLAALSEAAGGGLDGLLAAVGDAPLSHVGSFRNRRTRLGPVALEGEGGTVEVVLELDRTEFPGDVVHWEVEVEVDPDRAPAVGAALEALFRRAGVSGRSAPSKAKRFFRALAGEALDG